MLMPVGFFFLNSEMKRLGLGKESRFGLSWDKIAQLFCFNLVII